MSEFRAITVFEITNGDIVEELNNSIAYVQATYCFPMPSTYFNSVETKISNDKTYLEIHPYFRSEESFKDWLDVYGEIIEDLMGEVIEDLAECQLKVTRYVDNPELVDTSNMLNCSNFKSKILDNE